jgi:hypothetical protein
MRRTNTITSYALAAFALAATAAAGAPSDGDVSALVHRTPAGVAYRVTADGLTSMRFGQRDVASGSWSVFNAEDWFKPGGPGPHYRLWSGLRNWEIYQFLAPGWQMASRLYQGERDVPRDFETPDGFFFRNRISPLLPVSGFARLPSVQAAQEIYLNADGKKWKAAP